MSRRSPFESSQFGKSLSKQAAQEQIPVTSQAEGAFSGDTHLQGIPTTDKKARDRGWEKGNKTQSYWGIPLWLRESVRDVADSEAVKVDDIVRAFFEFALEEHQADRLTFSPVTNPEGYGKMTLYPKSAGWGQRTPWQRETYDPKPRSPRKGSKRKRSQANQVPQEITCVLTVRAMPVELHSQVYATAENNHVPVGEMVTALLLCSLKAYQAGELHFNPVPRPGRKTLFPEAE